MTAWLQAFAAVMFLLASIGWVIILCRLDRRLRHLGELQVTMELLRAQLARCEARCGDGAEQLLPDGRIAVVRPRAVGGDRDG